MPNMFGGPQDHPAYDPRRKLAANEAMSGNTLYTRKGNIIEAQEVDGTISRYMLNDPTLPKTVYNKLCGK
jgi:hypothetical protein